MAPGPNLLTPPTTINPPDALQLAQKAPLLLSKSASSLPWPLSLFSSSETPETWTISTNAFYSALRTGDDASARLLLTRLTSRFGDNNPHIITLRGVYEECLAKNNGELEQVLKKYDTLIKEDPTNFGIRKRKVVVLKSLGKTQESLAELLKIVDSSPTDVEAWAELAEMYKEVGAYDRAVFCLEEVLLVAPNAWAAHAEVATLHYLSALSSSPPALSELTLALHHFSRSIELNEWYLRGYYGLKVITKKLGSVLSGTTTSSKRNTDDDADVPAPKLQTVQKLEELATKKLSEIIRRSSAGEKGWTGFDEAEVGAARELLNSEGKIER